jgi:HEAT repeat protein
MCPGVGPSRRADVVRAGFEGDEQSARRSLVAADPRARSLALSALVRMGRATEADVAVALGDADPVVRRRGLQLLPRAAIAPGRVPDLLAHLPDADDRVTEMAGFAAGELVEVGPDVVAALAAVATTHDDALCRESAVAALGAIGDPAGLPAVLAATSDRANVRRRAALALAAFEGDEVEEALARLATDRDLQVRQAAEDLLAISEGTEL